MSLHYAAEPDLSAEEFRTVLIASTLGERRPVQDLARLDKMLRQADLIITARETLPNGKSKLLGVARALTDYSYCCYLSDLAVDKAFQHQGIGKRLIEETRLAAGPQATLHLIAAPAAEAYYPKIGMKHLPSCWALSRVE